VDNPARESGLIAVNPVKMTTAVSVHGENAAPAGKEQLQATTGASTMMMVRRRCAQLSWLGRPS